MGLTVALRGNLAALGDPSDHSLPGANPLFVQNGAAVIYERTGNTWSRAIGLFPPGSVLGTGYGLRVGISDDGARVLVSATLAGTHGQLHIYLRRSAGWVLEQTIDGANLSPPAQLKIASAQTAGKLFVACDNNGISEVRVFDPQGGVWAQTAILAPNLAAGSNFGDAIDVSGSDVVVAASNQANGTTVGVGQLYVYDLTQPNWQNQSVAIAAPTVGGVLGFGRDLDLRGDRLAVGASGLAFEYRRSGGIWNLFAMVEPPSLGSSSLFGYAVGLYSNGLLVGDSYYDEDPINYPDGPGAIHSYDLLELERPLQGCRRGVSIGRGGPLQLEVNWPQQAGKSYQIVGSFTGLGPTIVAGVPIPLTQDLYTSILFGNPAFVRGGSGILDANGQATMTWLVPPGLPASLLGLDFHHAVVAYDAVSLSASNPVTSTLAF